MHAQQWTRSFGESHGGGITWSDLDRAKTRTDIHEKKLGDETARVRIRRLSHLRRCLRINDDDDTPGGGGGGGRILYKNKH